MLWHKVAERGVIAAEHDDLSVADLGRDLELHLDLLGHARSVAVRARGAAGDARSTCLYTLCSSPRRQSSATRASSGE
jgi:hypothetical protein